MKKEEKELMAIHESKVEECFEFLKKNNELPIHAAVVCLSVFQLIYKGILHPDKTDEEIAEEAKQMILSMTVTAYDPTEYKQ